MTEFDDLETTAGGESDYDLDEWERADLDESGATVVGDLEAVLEDVGQYDATVYLIETEDNGSIMVFGNASINAGFENAEADAEDMTMVGIRNTGETYENKHGEFPQFEVRYQA